MDKTSFSVKIFDNNGPIAAQLEGYEVRPQQIQMVEAVDRTIASSGRLLVEAGTGVGKSLAYLVPFVNWAVAEDKRVVVSTYTKALQSQLYVKDLPFLERALGLPFRYALCMGSDNYVCMKKASRRLKKGLPEGKRAKSQIEKILKWVLKTGTGLRTDLDFEPDGHVWEMFSREPDMCLGRKCARSGDCFYLKARQEQSRAHVLVANHSLLFTDMMSDAKLLPDFHALVLDEAHTLEDVATGHFGKTFSNIAFERLFDGILSDAAVRKPGLSGEGEIKELADEVKDRARARHGAVSGLFGHAEEVFGKEDRTIDLGEAGFGADDISGDMVALSLALHNMARSISDAEEKEAVRALAVRCDALAEALDFILYQERLPEYVYWVDVKKIKDKTACVFHSAPVDISSELRENLFNEVSPVVLTSATLAACGKEGKPDFSFIRRRLGLDDCGELALDSPFDYGKNVLLYMPRGIPDPNEKPMEYREGMKDRIIEMFDILGGRIFALFTSYDMLNAVAALISAERPDIDMLKQGDLPRYVLLDVFKKDRKSVLMGTSTFWQGVDVPGSSLECVMIARLPFSVPTDPVNAARIKSLERKGRNAFLEYQLPQALIMFKQGFGRLIRSGSDRGVVAILDPRVRTRHYGKMFLDALPKCRRTDNIGDVRAFFGSGPEELRVEYEEE